MKWIQIESLVVEPNHIYIVVIYNKTLYHAHCFAVEVFRQATEYMMKALGSNEKIMKQVINGDYF